MPIIEWNDSYMLGVADFDDHHQHLFDLLRKIYADLLARVHTENVGSVLDELAEYSTYHFSAEERWMKEHSYPKLAEHIKEHERFSRRVAEMTSDYNSGKRKLTIEVMTFLNNWLTDHILQNDTDYSRYFANK